MNINSKMPDIYLNKYKQDYKSCRHTRHTVSNKQTWKSIIFPDYI